MKILVVGSGGREHALAWKLKMSRHHTHIFCAPGNAGIAKIATCVPVKSGDIRELIKFATDMKIDLTVVGPEAPLADGIVDEFHREGLPVFGPSRGAAQLEASKSFAKTIMRRSGIPTAEAKRFTDAGSAIKGLDEFTPPWVIKADGLAAGKGVTVTDSREKAEVAIRDALEKNAFGEAGKLVLLEEYLDGEELSVMAVSDSRKVLILAPAQDHKRINDNDEGPNTGGMGAYSPVPTATPELLKEVHDRILLPCINGMAEQDVPFRGILYAGLALTKKGPKVIEFNCRFGDPETQVILPRMKDDLLLVMMESIGSGLRRDTLNFTDDAALSIVASSGGYPGEYRTGLPISGLEEAEKGGAVVFHAGTRGDGDSILTAGGRVLNITATGATLADAADRAYAAAGMIKFEGMHYRRDIGARALKKTT
jgi:phosphoribosylamine--glycine ligase